MSWPAGRPASRGVGSAARLCLFPRGALGGFDLIRRKAEQASSGSLVPPVASEGGPVSFPQGKPGPIKAATEAARGNFTFAEKKK